ncbi:MAG: hypothetical protein AB7G37_05335 [Solirubrobacteraceae bacterium]
MTYAVVAALCATLVLAGCGDDEPSPFQTPGETEEAVADLGFPVLATRNTTRVSTSDPIAGAASVARAIYSGGAPETKAAAVTLVDSGDWRAALAATALMAPPLGAPILFSDGDSLPDASSDALKALAPTGSDPAGGKAQVIRVGDTARPDGLRSTTIDGADPYTLALGIDRFAAAARKRQSNRVLVVSADAPEYAAPAAAWAAKTGDPIAFVTKTGVPPVTARQLRDHQDPSLFVLGPSKVIPPAVSKALRRFGTVRRVGGQDPVTNAIAFAGYRAGSFGWGINSPGNNYAITRSEDVLSAISLAPLSASGLHGPLLLLDRKDSLACPLLQFLLDYQPGFYAGQGDPSEIAHGRAWIAGDPETVTPVLQSRIDALLEVSPVREQGNTEPAPGACHQIGASAAAPPTAGATTTPGTTTAPTPPAGR